MSQHLTSLSLMNPLPGESLSFSWLAGTHPILVLHADQQTVLIERPDLAALEQHKQFGSKVPDYWGNLAPIHHERCLLKLLNCALALERECMVWRWCPCMHQTSGWDAWDALPSLYALAFN